MHCRFSAVGVRGAQHDRHPRELCVAHDLWINGGSHVMPDGRWVIPYSPVDNSVSNADFATHVASLEHDDAIVLDPEAVYRIEELTATDATTTNTSRTPRRSLRAETRCGLDRLRCRRTLTPWSESSRQSFAASTTPLSPSGRRRRPLPSSRCRPTTPTRPASAVPPDGTGAVLHGQDNCISGRYQPEFVKEVTEEQRTARGRRSIPKWSTRLTATFRPWARAASRTQEDVGERRGVANAVSPTKDTNYIEIPVRDPAVSRGIVTQDPNYGRIASNDDGWVPTDAAKKDRLKTVRRPPPGPSQRTRHSELTPVLPHHSITPSTPPPLPLPPRLPPPPRLTPPALAASASTSTTLARSARPPFRRAQTWAPSSTATAGARRINRGAKHRILVPPWIRPELPADEVTADDGGGSDLESDDGGFGGNAEEYGDQSQSQTGAGAAARNGWAKPTRGRGGSDSGRRSSWLPQY